jgi:hypothetical protein
MTKIEKDLYIAKLELSDIRCDLETQLWYIDFLEDLLWWQRFINYCHTGK